jgi:type I restriction enzyme S subunit
MVVERKKKVEAKLFKKTKELSGVELDQQSFTIPSNWYWTRLGVIADWGSGSTPSRSNHDYYGGSHTWLKSGELNDVIGLRGSEEHVTERAIKECSFRLNQPEDVLIAMYGATIGKLAILAEIAVTNQAVCGCTTLSGVSNRYLFNFLMAHRAAFHSQSEGGAQPNISKEKIVNTPFPLPPLAEQVRIVAKVDELMALCDSLETVLKKRDELRRKLLDATTYQILGQKA